MLAFDVSGSAPPADSPTVLVLLHGRGSHRGDLQALATLIPPGWVLVTPQAPHPGHPWGYGPGWAWYRHLEADRVEERTLRDSLDALETFLDQLPTIVRAQPGRVVLGGFSQGGTTSLAYALAHPDSVAATVNFSGFLAEASRADGSPSGARRPPVFWAHGTRDPQVPWELARTGRERLSRAGVPLTARDYDIGHWLTPEEVAEAIRFLDGRREEPAG